MALLPAEPPDLKTLWDSTTWMQYWDVDERGPKLGCFLEEGLKELGLSTSTGGMGRPPKCSVHMKINHAALSLAVRAGCPRACIKENFLNQARRK